MLPRYIVLPREGHLQQVFHIFAHLKRHKHSRMVFDDTELVSTQVLSRTVIGQSSTQMLSHMSQMLWPMFCFLVTMRKVIVHMKGINSIVDMNQDNGKEHQQDRR